MASATTRSPCWLRLEAGPDGVVVDRGGVVQGLQLQGFDRLVLDPNTQQGLLLLCPRGFGRPMLGRWADGRLLAEPGSVPALGRRWDVVGSLVAIDRDPLRPRLGAVTGWVAVRGADGGSLEAAGVGVGAPAVYNCARPGDLDVLCRQVALVARRSGASVALAVGADRAQAIELLRSAPAGTLRVAVTCLSAAAVGQPSDNADVSADGGAERLRQLRNRMTSASNPAHVLPSAGLASGRALRSGGTRPPPQLPLPGLSPH
jgi:hypothetical protein